jgi:histidinol-phosphate aminotransferase
MSRFFDLVSKPVRNMGSYSPGMPLQPVAPQIQPKLIKLDSNENPFGPSPRAVEAMRRALAISSAYPDDDCAQLRRKLAEHHGLQPEQVMVSAGSTALLGLLCQTLLAPGLNAVTSQRSFIVYSLAVNATGASLIETPMANDIFDLNAILDAIDGKTRIVFLANPNNPTGTLVDSGIVDNFLARLPGHVIVVLDEAYYEFAMHFSSLRGTTNSKSLDYVRQGASVVVLRTFSKAHGLAGLRIGYGLGPPELLAYCARMRNTFSVSSVAQAAALAAVDDQDHIRRVVTNNADQAHVLTDALSKFGYRVVPTSTNFLYCDLGEDALIFARRLQDEGVGVRPLGAWGAPICIRVTIGTPEQNQFFLNAVRKIAGHNRSGQIARDSNRS